MSLTEEIRDYFEPEPHRAVSVHKNPGPNSTDNGLLFSATLLALLPFAERFGYQPWYSNLVAACQIEPGLYRRHPDNPDFNSHDDLTGVAIGGWLLGLRYAEDILDYGRTHLYSWNTEKPGKFTWRGFLPRILDFMPTIRSATGRNLTKFDYLGVKLACLWNRREGPEHTSGRCLMYLKHLALYGQRPDIDRVIDTWRADMRKLYPSGMKDVYKIYFGPDHPFTKYAPEDFGESFKL